MINGAPMTLELPPDLKDELIAVVSKIAAWAYSQGSEDTRNRIMAAAAGVAAVAHARADKAPESRESKMNTLADGTVVSSRAPSKRAPKGSVPKAISMVLTDPDYRGLDYAGIARRAEQMGAKDIAIASIRNRLREMEIEGDACREGDIWRLTTKGREAIRKNVLATHPMFN